MSAAGSPVLVGRRAELDQLVRTLGIAPAGDGDPASGAAVLVSGDAGVGKTRLLTELAGTARGAGWHVVAGHCLDFADHALPYLPFSEILERLTALVPEAVDDVLREHPSLARLQPGRRVLTQRDDDAEPGQSGRQDLLAAVQALLARAAATTPLLVVVEDAHWADPSTRDLLGLLFARERPPGLAVVASYRSDDLHRRHPLRRQAVEWSRLPGVERLPLRPLSEDDVRRLIAELTRGALGEAQVADVVARAEGNPFFVEELVSAPATGAAVGAGQAVPADLAELLLVRLDGLDEHTQQVVRAAAAAGRRVGHALLAEVSGLDDLALDAALRSAVEHHVLVPDGEDSYAFRHALLAEAVHDDLLPGERARLHATYVRVLREGRVAGTAAELARHARLAHDPRTALEATVRAGREAMRIGGPAEAADRFVEALALAADPGVGDLAEVDLQGLDLVDVAVNGADALAAAGHVTRAVKLLRDQVDGLAPDAPDEHRGRLLAVLAGYLAITDTTEDVRAMSERALGLQADAPPRRRARALARHALILAYHRDAQQARPVALDALALAKEHDLPGVEAEVRTVLLRLDQGAPAARLAESVEQVAAEARRTGALSAELQATYLLGRISLDQARFPEALEAFSATAARGREEGRPWAPYAFESRLMAAQVLVDTGRLDEALALLDVDDDAPPEVPAAMLAALRAHVLARRGDPAAARVARELRPVWSTEGLVGIHGGAAEIEVAEQHADPAAALEVYDALVSVLSVTWRELFQARLRLAASTLSVLATAAERLGASERAALAAEADRLLDDGRRVHAAHTSQAVGPGPESQAWAQRLEAEHLRWRWTAQVGAPTASELEDGWRGALEAFERYGNVFELARVRGRLGQVLRATGGTVQTDEAEALRQEVRADAERLGAPALLTGLDDGGRPRPADGGPADVALTRREREIVALVADGRTNGEIGRQLFISTKTVSVHVSNVLAKLGASSRTEAAALARRRGLLD